MRYFRLILGYGLDATYQIKIMIPLIPTVFTYFRRSFGICMNFKYMQPVRISVHLTNRTHILNEITSKDDMLSQLYIKVALCPTEDKWYVKS